MAFNPLVCADGARGAALRVESGRMTRHLSSIVELKHATFVVDDARRMGAQNREGAEMMRRSRVAPSADPRSPRRVVRSDGDVPEFRVRGYR